MKTRYLLYTFLSVLLFSTSLFAQSAYVNWPLSSSTTINPNTPVGNIQASAETIAGMTIFLPYITDGQRLYFPNTGWPASGVDYTRYLQFDASPTTGNSYTVEYVSFNYGDHPLPADFHILKSEVWYSLDGWNTNNVMLSTTPLDYLNSAMQTFSKSISVPVADGQTFSLRIYPYTPAGGIASSPTFATHNTVRIEGTTTPAVGCVEPPNGMVGWWTGDGNPNDIQGGNHGTLQNGATFATGKVDQAFKLDGVNDRVEILDAPNLRLQEFTIDAWVKLDENQLEGIVCKQFGNGSLNSYALDVENGKLLGVITDGTGNHFITSGVTVPVDQFVHTAMTWDGSTMRLYLNGDLVKDQVLGAITISYDDNPILLGADDNGLNAFGIFLSGLIDEVEIFDRALEAFEIQSIYNAGSAGKCKPDTTLGSLCGVKFNDLNGNGANDNEPGLSGWEINLTYQTAAGNTTLIDTTDANGNYCFDNLQPGGTYTVSETNQDGWEQTFPAPPGTYTVNLTSNLHLDTLNFGNRISGTSDSCTDFEDGNGGWTTNNAIGTIIEEGDNHYFQTTDQSGASSFFNESEPLTGDWAAFLDGGCGTLCWDVNYLYAGNNNDGSSQPITVTPYIAIVGNGFSAYFLTNDLITAGDGWHSYCAPLSLINPGESLPANSAGHWVMSVGTDSDWNSMLSNITRIAFSIDPTSYQAERFGFDNICLTNTGECGSTSDLCESLGAEAIKTSPDDCNWSLNLIQPNDLTGITSIQILCLLPNQFTTGTGLGTNYQDWFISGSNTFTPPNGIVPGGNLNDFFNMSLSYVTSPQIVIVNWLDDSGEIVCAETVELDCEISCTSIQSDTVTCNGSDYTYSYSFTNNADYGISSIEYTLQSPGNVTISPLTSNLSWAVSPGSNSILQNIQIVGAFPGDTVSILAKFNSPDGCCWCYETITAIMPSCITVCDSLSVEAQGNPEDCCYSISLTNNSSMEFSHVEFELVSGGMFSTFSTSATGWGFTNAWPNNLIKLRKFPPFTQTIGQGTFSDVLDMCIRDYTSPNQVVAVRWMNNGEIVCTDTLMFECTSIDLPIDSCSQANNGTLTCLPNGTFLYKFRVQNNSTIMSTGYGIYPTTPGVTFSKTLFENVNILPGQVSPLDSIIISGIGGGEELCFQTAIFNTVVPGESVYNFCCHSDIFCITTPECGEPTGCVDPPSGMVAWWTLDEISGTSSLDLASFDNMGTHMNSPVPVAAKVLGGLQFSGKNFVDVPHQLELNFGTGDFSFDTWIQTSNDVGIQHLVDKRVKNSSGIFGYLFYLVDGKLSLRLEDGTATDYVSPVFVADGMFHHIAITVSRSDQNGITFYLDGAPTTFGDPTAHPGSLDNRGILRIGAQSFVENYSFRGILDEIELFNRAITKDEVNSIYEAGSNGKCKPTTDVYDDEQIPKKIELMQSYPNPFNPSTTIRYNLSKAGFVKLAVYDILGREVTVLVNEDQNPGQHNIIFKANNLASGIYIYTLKTGDFYQSKKMILMK